MQQLGFVKPLVAGLDDPSSRGEIVPFFSGLPK
jgi:hypothetical protein